MPMNDDGGYSGLLLFLPVCPRQARLKTKQILEKRQGAKGKDHPKDPSFRRTTLAPE